jgi:pimeloyl-ACP methyl ester carboxylesterase
MMDMHPSLAKWGKTLSTKRGSLFFYDTGPAQEGKPPLLLIHGLGDEADSWRSLVPILHAAGHRVIAPDLPGFGRSSPRGANIRGQTAAVIALLEETSGPGNPAALAGNSMGAVIAEATAFSRPRLVRALVLIDGCFPMKGGINSGLILMSLPFIGKKWYRAFRHDHEGAWRSLYPFYGDLDAMSDDDKQFLRKRVIDRVESGGQEKGCFASLRSLNALGLFRRGSFARRLKTYTGKILLIWGEKDAVIPRSAAEEFLLRKPDAALKTIKGAGHLPHQERPRETAEAMLAFLSGGE